MDKTRTKFMQNAPTVVIVGGCLSLLLFIVIGIVLCFTDDWKFGVFTIALCLSALCFVEYAIKRLEKSSGISVEDAIARDKEYWKSQAEFNK